jgi:hypothetical protein
VDAGAGLDVLEKREFCCRIGSGNTWYHSVQNVAYTDL